MATTVTDIINNLKTQFGERFEAVTVDRAFIYNMFNVARRDFTGGDLKEFITGSRQGSVMATGEKPNRVPSPSPQKGVQMTIKKHVIFASIGWDWVAQELTKSNMGAFISQGVFSLERMLDEMVVELERQSVGNGTGVLTEGGASVGINVGTTDATNSPWYFDVPLNDAVNYYIGQRVQFWDGGDEDYGDLTMRDYPVATGYYTVSNVVPGKNADNSDSTTRARITIAENSPNTNKPDDNDWCIKVDAMIENAGNGGKNITRELYGLRDLVGVGGHACQTDTDSGTAGTTGYHQGIDPATNGFWRGNRVDANGTRKLGPSVLRELTRRMQINSSKGPGAITAYFTHPDRVADYEGELGSQTRIKIEGAQTPDATGGFKSSVVTDNEEVPTYGGKKILASRFIKDTHCYAPNFNHLKRFVLKDFEFRPAHDDYSGRPATQQEGFMICSLATDDRSAHGFIDELKKPS